MFIGRKTEKYMLSSETNGIGLKLQPRMLDWASIFGRHIPVLWLGGFQSTLKVEPSNALRTIRCIPSMDRTKVKQSLNSFMWGLSQMTRNGSMRRSACLEAIRQLSLRKLGSQEARLRRVGGADFTP